MKTGVSLKYFVHDCLWKQDFGSKLPQTLSDLISSQFWQLQGVSHGFNPMLEQLELQKSAKTSLTW